MRNRVWQLMGPNGRSAFKAHHGAVGDLSDGDAKEILFARIVAEFFTPGLVTGVA